MPKKISIVFVSILFSLIGKHGHAQGFRERALNKSSQFEQYIENNSYWELSLGFGLIEPSRRTVYSIAAVPTGAPNQPFGARRQLYMRANYLFDFDFKHSIYLSPRWAFTSGFGVGLMEYEVFWQDFQYNFRSKEYTPSTTENRKTDYNYTTRFMIGGRYNQPLSNSRAITLMAFTGFQLNGWEKDYRLQEYSWNLLPDFSGDFLYSRPFFGFEMGLLSKLKQTKQFQANLNVSYRYLHFYSGHDYLATHVIKHLHQIVLGWGFKANPD